MQNLDLNRYEARWWHTPAAPALGRWREEDPEFKVRGRRDGSAVDSTS